MRELARGCVSCHIIGDKEVFGRKPLGNIAGRYNVDTLRAFYDTPTPPMPPVRMGSEEEFEALTAYLLSL